MTKLAIPSLLLALALFVVGCTSPPASSPSVQPTAPGTGRATTAPEPTTVPNPTTITVDELKTMLQSKDFVLINVHIPYEGEIPGTDVHIPYNEMEKHADPQQTHIWFESCSDCEGSFFDAGEFRDLAEHTMSDFFKRIVRRKRD